VHPLCQTLSTVINKLSRIILCICLLIPATHYAAENKAEINWDKCAEQAANSTPPELGIAGGNASVSTQCGTRPTVKTVNGTRLLRSDCDWLYKHPLNECASYTPKSKCNIEADSNLLPFDLISMSSYRSMFDLSEKTFSKEKFTDLCRNSCNSGAAPSREQFGRELCGE